MWKKSTLKKCIDNMRQSMLQDKLEMKATGELIKYVAKKVNKLDEVRMLSREMFNGCMWDVSKLKDVVFDGKVFDYTLIDSDSLKERKVTGQKMSKFIAKFSDLESHQIAQLTHHIRNPKAYYIGFANMDYRVWYVSGRENNVIESCMDYRGSHFDRVNANYEAETDPRWQQYLHPVDLYETNSELRLGLLFSSNPFEWDGVSEYPLLARVWVLDTRYSTIYTKCSNNRDLFKRALKDGNFAYSPRVMDDLVFYAKRDVNDEVVVPYFDPGNMAFNLAEDESEFTKLTINDGGEYQTSHRDGSIEETERQYCDHCQEHHCNDESSSDYVDSQGAYIGQIVGDCRDSESVVALGVEGDTYTSENDATYSDYHGHYILDYNVVYVFTSKGEAVSDEDSDLYQEAVCLDVEYQGCEYASPDCVTNVDNEYYLTEEQSDLFYRCCVDGEYYSFNSTDAQLLSGTSMYVNSDNLEVTP